MKHIDMAEPNKDSYLMSIYDCSADLLTRGLGDGLAQCQRWTHTKGKRRTSLSKLGKLKQLSSFHYITIFCTCHISPRNIKNNKNNNDNNH